MQPWSQHIWKMFLWCSKLENLYRPGMVDQKFQVELDCISTYRCTELTRFTVSVLMKLLTKNFWNLHLKEKFKHRTSGKAFKHRKTFMANFLERWSCMFQIISILYVFPYRAYNTSFKKYTLVCNICVSCITEKSYVLFYFGRRKMLTFKISLLRDALHEE